jgi:hypothetical protein
MAKEKMDSSYYGMISEDHSAVANLPQEVVQKTYPRMDYMGGELDDTIREIDSVRKDEIRKIREYPSKVKY